ncbi:MAG: ribonuclease HII [Promethearchaeota archaeon]
MKKILGIDEAGRGPVLGDLFVGAVLCNLAQIQILRQNNVNDSKKLSKTKRELLYNLISQNCIKYIVKRIPVKVIDENIKSNNGKNLNMLEKEIMCELIEELQADEVYIDAIGNNPKKFTREMYIMLEQRGKISQIPKIIARNKGDSLFTIVGAASIMAKVQRDKAIESYRKEYEIYGSIGSGYPSDKYTIQFLRRYISKNHKPPEIARKSWETVNNLMNEIVWQKRLRDFVQ